jgi:predicted phosphodiesterase
VEIKAEILEPALANVTFNWNGTNYTIYDDSVVLMFNFDSVAALYEDYSTPGGLVKDVSRWENNGSVGIGNDPTTVPKWLPDGRYGGAFDFAGNGSTYGQSILVIPHDPSLNPGSGDFAIAVWVLPRSDIDGDILRKGSTGTATTWYKLEHSPSPSNNRFSLNFNTDGTDATVTSPQAYNDDQWHFVLAQRRGGTAQLWIDGALVGSATVSGSISNDANLTVGSKDTQADDFINATLDEVRIYRRSFAQDEIQILYNSNLSKADQNTWYLYVNPSNLTGGTYTYQASATNTSSQTSTAGPRSVTMDAPPVVAVIIKGPYLQQVTSDSIVIMWETDVAADSRVDFGGTFVEDGTPVTIHEVQLTGLAADTVYSYTVTSGATTSPISTFGTTPDVSRSFRFVAYGDTRSQPAEHASVIAAIIDSAPEIVIHTGDLVTDGTNYSLWEAEFFSPAYDLMINTPLLAVLGNHENNAAWFYDLFSLPDNEQWFAFTYGNIRFIGLNTCVSYSPGSTQYASLVGELGSPEYANATWHVVYFHHPPYSATSSHGDDANVKQYLVPLFEQNGVDIVFNGHSHAYERYFNNGIYYIVTGGGGAPLASLVTDTQEPIRQYGQSVYHHCTIDVDVPGQSLTVSARYNNGTAFDTITITKTNKATNPNPSDGAIGVSLDADLSWKAGAGGISHDVYFGTNPAPGAGEFKGSQTVATFDPGAMDYGSTYYWRIDEFDGSTTHTGDVWSFTTRPSSVDDVANADIAVEGTITGDYTETQASGGPYEAITEITSGGGKNVRSSLTHKWTFSVTGANTVTFHLEAYHTPNGEGDDFVLAYSTDNVTYTDMLTVTKTTDDNTYQMYTLPSSISGTVYIRVQDADQTRSNGSLDTVYVDHMFIRSSMAGSPPTKIYVNDITMSYQKTGPNYSGLATVWIKDNAGADVAGATVSGSWSGGVSGTSTGVTGSDGKVTLQSPRTKNGGTFTFAVTNVAASGYTYDPVLNNETTDSITVP